jgi:hypothetical protein
MSPPKGCSRRRRPSRASARAWPSTPSTRTSPPRAPLPCRPPSRLRTLALLHECRALVPQLEAAGTDPETVSAQAERLLYYALVGATEEGLVRTAADTLTVLRQASAPLGPMGA